jgi:predicted transcriptional regulator
VTETSTVVYVARSDARRTVLRALAAEPRRGDGLVSALELSKSGVYKAINELRDRRLLAQKEGDVWDLTALGRLVTDELDRQRWLEGLFANREYWLTHDVSTLPGRFRRRLPELRNADLLSNPDNDPRYLERYWAERMPEYDRLWVGSRVFHSTYGDAMDDQAAASGATRLIVHAPLVDQRSAAVAAHEERRPAAVDTRVCELPCSFMLTEDLFTLSLPLPDGGYDQDTVLVGGDEAALRFGADLFGFYWERAAPVGAYLAEIADG